MTVKTASHRSEPRPSTRAGRRGRTGSTVVVAHPGAELYGSDRVLLETVTALGTRYDRVVVALPEHGPLSSELVSRGARVVTMRSPVLRKSILRPRGFARFVADLAVGTWQGVRLLRRERPALIFVNTVTIPLWLVLSRMSRVPSVCHVHEAEDGASKLLRYLLALPLLLANQIIANSRFSADVLGKSIRRLGSASVVVLNAVPGPPHAEMARAETNAGLRVTYVGRISPRKGVDVAVEAVAQLRARGINAVLDIYGAVFAGYEWFEAELRDRIVDLDMVDSVRFHGFCSDVWDGISRGDVVVVPSRLAEPFGNTAVEAILSGRPVVASAIGGLVEAVDGYRSAARVQPGDASALASALDDVRRRWVDVRQDAWSDRQLALRRHDADQYGLEILRTIDDVHDSAPQTPRRGRSDYPVSTSAMPSGVTNRDAP
ncbi:glycosyltransferase [Marisediminicola sp. LYQ134]|uniref:glycosyltransferase n=1 Tax=Marisediminicola sp. LYQ134 TaxID=3391061 RepID=UPI0039833BA2